MPSVRRWVGRTCTHDEVTTRNVKRCVLLDRLDSLQDGGIEDNVHMSAQQADTPVGQAAKSEKKGEPTANVGALGGVADLATQCSRDRWA